MKARNKIAISILVAIVIVAVYTVIDSFNLVTKIIPPFSNLNADFYSIFFGAVLSILGYIITYILIDKRQKEKDDNSRNTANLFLNESYRECRQWISWTEDPQLWAGMIKHVDYNSTEDKVSKNLSIAPFVFDEKVTDFAFEGVISAEQYKTYIEIKSAYSKYINTKIVFPDVPEMLSTVRKELDNALKKAK